MEWLLYISEITNDKLDDDYGSFQLFPLLIDL